MRRESLCGPLIGRQLTSAAKDTYSWCFGFGDKFKLVTESAWRVLDEQRIVVSSEDHGQKFGLAAPVDAASLLLSQLAGRTVDAAEISPLSGDLLISFAGQLQLQCLQLSTGYESWHLFVDGSETICMGGGGVTHIPRS